jgi:copper resistance protein B
MTALRPPVIAAMLGCLVSPMVIAQQDQFPLPPEDWPEPVMDRPVIPFLLIDRLEYRWKSGDDLRVWDVHAWIGGDYNKLWLRSEGEDVPGESTERADIEAFYARIISPFWYLQAGLREEFKPSPSRTALALGVEGLAPYWFDVEATAYLDEEGTLSARLEAEYDILLTQRLILQPRIETGFATSGERERGVGQGFDAVELGLRLRYEIRRQFAPYVGISWSRKLGETADFAREQDEDVTETAFVAGVRIWF